MDSDSDIEVIEEINSNQNVNRNQTNNGSTIDTKQSVMDWSIFKKSANGRSNLIEAKTEAGVSTGDSSNKDAPDVKPIPKPVEQSATTLDASRSKTPEMQMEVTPDIFFDDDIGGKDTVRAEIEPGLLEPEVVVNETKKSDLNVVSRKSSSNVMKIETENCLIEVNEVEIIDLEEEYNKRPADQSAAKNNSKSNKKPKVFIIDDNEDDNLTINETIKHFSDIRKRFRENPNNYESFLSNAIISLCRIKPHRKEKSPTFIPSDIIHIFLDKKKSTPFENDESQPLKSLRFENKIFEKFCSKLQKLNKAEGNKIEEALANIEHLRKLNEDFPNHLINFNREKELFKFVIGDLEKATCNLAPLQVDTLKVIIEALKNFESRIHMSFVSLFADLMKMPEIKEKEYDIVYTDQLGDVFNQTCQLLEDRFGKIERIYYCAENNTHLVQFKGVGKLVRINFNELVTQQAEQTNNAMLKYLERIFKLKNCGEFHNISVKTNRTLFLNRVCHENSLNRCNDQIVIMNRNGSDDLEYFYLPKKECIDVNVDPNEYFQTFMFTIFKNLYHFRDFNCFAESNDTNPRKIYDRSRDIFNFDQFFNEEINWLTVLIFNFSRNVDGVEYFVPDPTKK